MILRALLSCICILFLVLILLPLSWNIFLNVRNWCYKLMSVSSNCLIQNIINYNCFIDLVTTVVQKRMNFPVVVLKEKTENTKNTWISFILSTYIRVRHALHFHPCYTINSLFQYFFSYSYSYHYHSSLIWFPKHVHSHRNDLQCLLCSSKSDIPIPFSWLLFNLCQLHSCYYWWF